MQCHCPIVRPGEMADARERYPEGYGSCNSPFARDMSREPMRHIRFPGTFTQAFKGVFARISTFSTCGETANSSVARAPNAFAISPVKWALRPASFAKLSKMPNLAGPILNAYHFKVPFSFSASG